VVYQVFFIFMFLFFSILCSPAFSEDINCLMCHEAILQKKFQHAAAQMGCATCHTAIDARDIPHKKTNNLPRGLSSELPDLCYNCHDKAEFSKKNVHMPVAGGMCGSCHNPHASNEFALLNKPLNGVCYDCHADVRRKPHADVGHSLGDKKPVDDPARPGKRFYCGSCHNPHSSDSIRLFRYPARSAAKLCTHCHKY